jgi:hypothetical protein
MGTREEKKSTNRYTSLVNTALCRPDIFHISFSVFRTFLFLTFLRQHILEPANGVAQAEACLHAHANVVAGHVLNVLAVELHG